MRALIHGFSRTPGSPVNEIHQALRAVGTDPAPHLLGYTAVARVNPYQAMLYRQFASHGVAAAPVLKGFDFSVLPEFRGMSRSQTIHFHWINWVIGVSEDAARARTKANGFLGRLDKFKDRGGKVVWTVHNVYPHDATYPDEEIELRQEVANRADVVHVMAESTTDAMKGILSVDRSKLVVAPHPSYVDAYENFVSRADARASLGIDGDETVFVVFGALKAYKGLNELLDAFQHLRRIRPDQRFRLVVAGSPDDDPRVTSFVQRCLVDPYVLIEPSRIPGNRAQYYLNAADVGAVTYTRSLNSGAALLYLSFGLPVLATDTPVFREALPTHTAHFVTDPLNRGHEAFAQDLVAAAELARRRSREQVLRAIEPLHSAKISDRFVQDLGRHLDW
ncbi:glycosyltransferase family 4 protein [Kocuria tytonis]|uniref:Glycosyltransferase n=1 Tax=Kocuria tytonis TaxID=2054280 RepID=A0A495A8Y2_9MICC|nr:glycosyltransferase family 4 protein [Kocuria tytonis]RKQ36418.1 glycosyltransferase [Kocuria tytonis]